MSQSTAVRHETPELTEIPVSAESAHIPPRQPEEVYATILWNTLFAGAVFAVVAAITGILLTVGWIAYATKGNF